MRYRTLTCSVCGKEWKRQRAVGAQPKRCPDCRRPAYQTPPTTPPVVLVVPIEDIEPFFPPSEGYTAKPNPILGPCPCRHCREPLFWAKRPTRRLGIMADRYAWREEDGIVHRCPKVWAATA